MQQVKTENVEMLLSDFNPIGIYHKLGFKLKSVFVLSTPLGMVCRLKYIVSNRARPPSTAGLGYGKSENIVFLTNLLTLL